VPSVHGVEESRELITTDLLFDGLADEPAERLCTARRDFLLGLLERVGGDRESDLDRGHTFIILRGTAPSMWWPMDQPHG
jgi:hypothetical protein